MVIFAIGGGAAVIGIANYDVYSDYSDHHDYSNYSDYSDAAERKKRRVAAMKQEIEGSVEELSDYKRTSVNPNLTSPFLKDAPAMTVSEKQMDDNAKSKIYREVNDAIHDETASIQAQIDAVDNLLERISQIEREEKS